MTGEPIFLDAALKYAALGWRVFPLSRNSKKPHHGSHGLADATTDADQIKEWAKVHPNANLGIRTGPESGICVVDIDPAHGGFESERHLRAQGKTWPETPVQRTRSGGRHVILQHHAAILTGGDRLGREIDFRGRGGYIVGAPSIVDGKAYSWLCWPACGPAPVPGWLLDHLAAEAAQRQAKERADAKPLPAMLEPEIERARKALCFVPADDRDTWLTVGMSLSGSFGDSGRALWDAWSRQSAKYNEAGQAKAWRSFKGSSRTVGTIFWLRRQNRGRSQIYSL